MHSGFWSHFDRVTTSNTPSVKFAGENSWLGRGEGRAIVSWVCNKLDLLNEFPTAHGLGFRRQRMREEVKLSLCIILQAQALTFTKQNLPKLQTPCTVTSIEVLSAKRIIFTSHSLLNNYKKKREATTTKTWLTAITLPNWIFKQGKYQALLMVHFCQLW